MVNLVEFSDNGRHSSLGRFLVSIHDGPDQPQGTDVYFHETSAVASLFDELWSSPRK
jgi:hypothetical protein